MSEKPWRFCPWCGDSLASHLGDPTMNCGVEPQTKSFEDIAAEHAQLKRDGKYVEARAFRMHWSAVLERLTGKE